jgi:four helix bundle protein
MNSENNIIKDKTFSFAERIVKLAQYLVLHKHETVLSDQIFRSGTSIGANIEEADASISKAEFSAKISIAYKEAKETNYWLRLLFSTGYIDKKEFDSIFTDCEEICKILYSILKSSGRIRPSEE